MDKSIQITWIIVVGVVFLALLGVYGFNLMINQNQNQINVNGQATIKAMPDLATVYFDVQAKGDTSAVATKGASDIVEKLTNNLLTQGFTKEQIVTQSFSVNPEYDWSDGKQIPKGYKAYHSIKIEMPSSQASKLGSVIDAGVGAGAGISYINFELSPSKQNEYKQQAMAQAAQDAKAKAQGIVDGLGKKLGKLVSISVNDYGYYPWNIYSSRGGEMVSEVADAKIAAQTNIQPGEQDITASVSVAYKIA